MSTSTINVRTAIANRPYIQFWVTKSEGTTGYGIRVYRKQDIDLVRQVARAFNQYKPYVLMTPTAESVAVIYINQFNDTKFLMELRKFFDIKNDTPEHAKQAIARAQAREKAIAICKARISRFNLNTIKHTMVSIFGSPAEVKSLFNKHNIKIVGNAQLPQCLRLLELEKKLQMCLTMLQQQSIKATVNVAVPSSSSKAIEPAHEVIPPQSVLTCAYEAKSCPLTCEYVAPEVTDYPEYGDGPGYVVVDQAFLEEALGEMTLKQIRAYMKEYGITGRGTRGYNRQQLIDHVIEAKFYSQA